VKCVTNPSKSGPKRWQWSCQITWNFHTRLIVRYWKIEYRMIKTLRNAKDNCKHIEDVCDFPGIIKIGIRFGLFKIDQVYHFWSNQIVNLFWITVRRKFLSDSEIPSQSKHRNGSQTTEMSERISKLITRNWELWGNWPQSDVIHTHKKNQERFENNQCEKFASRVIGDFDSF
jgi:hypothetical protein